MTTDFRALCAELVRRWDTAPCWPSPSQRHDLLDIADAMNRARTLLAQPVAEGPTDEELLELMPQQFRNDLATVSRMAAMHPTVGPDVTPGIFRVTLNTGALEYARAVLAKWGHQ